MRHGSLFSGIGGFDLAAEWMGWENVFHCEWNEFGQKVLKHYWPNAELFTDITKSDFKKYHGTIDIISGGFPCQPYSAAGKRLGKEDSRHLWPEMLRAIREIQPRWVVGENVLGLVNWSGGLVFDEVQTDLEAAGYEVFPYVLPAVSVGAPHRRDRIWFVAHAIGSSEGANKFRCVRFPNAEVSRQGSQTIHDAIGSNGFEGNAADPLSVRLQQCENSGEVGDRQSEVRGTGGELANGTEANGKVSNAPNTNGNGFNQCNCKHEKQSSEGRQYAFGNIDEGDGDGNAADTNISAAGTPGASGGVKSDRGADDVQQSERGSEAEQHNRSSSISRNAADTGDTGLQGGAVIGGVGSGRAHGNKYPSGCVPPNWEEFPTVSPICVRDDGIPDRLDGITFPKWRNESIKAAGNAIVPQVVFQIFKAIEQYEQLP